MGNIEVSIVCNAYNHEKYIRQALEGFVIQKTNFNYEVLVHDDASIDGTADIIREFEEKYPMLIKPIYQKENQYSKNKKIGLSYQYPRAKGKYIAICEGDDYWIDPLKLQKQYDAMENHKEVDVCAHGARIEKMGKIKGEIAPSSKDTIFNVEDVILGGGGFVSTNSLMFRKEVLLEVPEYKRILSMDYVIQIQGSLRGGMLYLADYMSVYRAYTENSWTSRMKNNVNAQSDLTDKLKKMLQFLNSETGYLYDAVIKEVIRYREFDLLEVKRMYGEMLKKEYKDVMKKAPFKRRFKIYLKYIRSFFIDKGH